MKKETKVLLTVVILVIVVALIYRTVLTRNTHIPAENPGLYGPVMSDQPANAE